ncbi:hypothetical protein SAMN05428976_10263 [Clostridium sp. USBA 49]|uniref:hypothetical protein n=1 Tax=Clostridium sp. USBA 49 TaxID=1881060 RepID=UPI00099A3D24|nr:hypothetical protein [Clostridium sp. USBA 49]SKA75132.1 hypothetical protein SAMN05428976_10263 [Clostridium sp. USBA 49]
MYRPGFEILDKKDDELDIITDFGEEFKIKMHRNVSEITDIFCRIRKKDNNIDIFLPQNNDKYLVCEIYDKLVTALEWAYYHNRM